MQVITFTVVSVLLGLGTAQQPWRYNPYGEPRSPLSRSSMMQRYPLLEQYEMMRLLEASRNEIGPVSQKYLSYNGQIPRPEASVLETPEFRQNGNNNNNNNNFNSLFSQLFSWLPNTFVRNPDAGVPLTNQYDSCTDSSGGSGICIRSSQCSTFGGRPSGSCGVGTVCCINTIAKCGGQVTVNNTYWQTPESLSSMPTCGLTITLDNSLVEQPKKICQVRLDFISFSIAQPNTETKCNTDTFIVAGTSSRVPTICGDNTGQHMYLEAPSTSTDIHLIFSFSQMSNTRQWNIKVSLLPCGSMALAPAGCLQYFTQSSGMVSSFNWKDVSGTATRQLANQDYKICFRTEYFNNQLANKICYSPCSLMNGGAAFRLSGTDADKAQKTMDACNNDYLIIEAGYDPAVALSKETNSWDRFCGNAFNPAAEGASVTVCSTVKSFAMTYRTNDDESISATVDSDTTLGNIGFCLNFQQSA